LTRADSKVLAAADLAIGLGSDAIGFALSLMRHGQPRLAPVVSPVTGVAHTAMPIAELTGLPAQLRDAAERGRRERAALTSAAARGVLGLVPQVTTVLLDQIDLTSLVAERIDVAGLAKYIIEELDLPELIRSSMGSITSDTVRGNCSPWRRPCSYTCRPHGARPARPGVTSCLAYAWWITAEAGSVPSAPSSARRCAWSSRSGSFSSR